jgi:uncharacterized caspase-like protein
MNGVNYLIPVDATIARDVDVEDEAISLDRVVRTLEPARHLQLVILDSCRDNPFVRSMKRTLSSGSKGDMLFTCATGGRSATLLA